MKPVVEMFGNNVKVTKDYLTAVIGVSNLLNR